MTQEADFLLRIIKYLLNNQNCELPNPQKGLNWENLFRLAERHSILNLVYYGVESLPEEKRPDGELHKYLYQHAMQEIAKCYNQIEAAKELLNHFEEEGVRALVVKGICTKQHYPQLDMRTMGDVDVLYQESQHEKMKKVMARLEYDKGLEGRKHDHYFREPFISMEMHRTLVATDSEYSSYYENIWDRLQTKKDYNYIYEMSKEDEYIYTLVHLVEHFRRGGIGIRFVMDVYVYNSMKDMDWSYIENELKQLKLWEFYRKISCLAEMWFGEAQECTEEEETILKEMSAYIVTNGTFGSTQNAAAISVSKRGRVGYLLETIFPNLKSMQSMFPWLKKWPILLPYSWVLRGIRSVLFRRKNIKIHFDKYKHGNKTYGEELNKFFKTCGL